MHYEYEDYRAKPPKPYLGPWLTYSVPEFFVVDYIMKMFFILFLLPYLFGFVFTVMGFFLNTIFVDYILYWSYKRKIDQMWS
tara:strand:+ start:687 stop:932 length:246 start_codon:yes stop_codon:yes gene_type:complete